MALYEPVDNRKLNLSYSLHDLSISTNRLQTGITDNFATLSLAKLIDGGIRSYKELEAAEQCLRSLIFHEKVVCQAPAVFVNQGMVRELKFENSPIDLNKYIGGNIISYQFGSINNLKSFTDQNEAVSENLRRKYKVMKQKELNLKFGIPEPKFSLCFDSCPLEKVADDISEYTKSRFAKDLVLQSRFILPISASKLPSYISYPFLIKNFERSPLNIEKTFKADEFFNSIDDIWRLYNERLRNKIDLQIPLFLTIVLGRTKNRKDINRVILELREEFERSRFELWSIFEQLDDVNISDGNYVKILTDLDESTKSIFNRELLHSSKSKSILALDNLKRFTSIISSVLVMISSGLDIGYIISMANSILNSFTVGNSFNISGARIVANHIKDIDYQKVLSNSLTEQELKAVKNSLRNYF